MLLALDIGNSNIVAGVFSDDRLVAQWRISTERDRTSDEMGAFFKVQFDLHGLQFNGIDGVAISSVVPSLTPQAAMLARDYFHCEPLIVGPHTNTGLVNTYDNPRDVGADRLVNGLAAWRKYGTAVVIADFGTATTVDAVTLDGRYVGGAIAPGLQISTDALFRAAARLPRVELVAPEQTLGRNTAHSMQAGIVFGYAGLTKELVGRCCFEIVSSPDERVTVVATGGLAELIAPLVPQIDVVEPHLTLEGLRLLWRQEN